MKKKFSIAISLSVILALTFVSTVLAALPAQVTFATDAPCAVNVLVSSYTDSTGLTGQTTSGSTSDPLTLSTFPATTVTFLYSSFVICNGVTYNFVSASPGSPITSGAENTTVTVTGHYILPDATPPVWTVPQNISREATSSTGAVVTYAASATDPDDAVSTQSCLPASGTTFALGATTVNCTATDTHNNTGTASFTVTVVDTTAPILSLPANITVAAMSTAGAAVIFSTSANDLVDGPMVVTCLPASGSLFPIGQTTVNCSATDKHLNTRNGSFTVTVVDNAGPVLTLPANITVPATSVAGATVNFTASANDLVDGPVPITCLPASGSLFSIGTITVNCSAVDLHGNTSTGSFTVTVVDNAGPVLTLPANITVPALDPSGVIVSFVATANDQIDGSVPVVCVPASGSLFPVGVTTVNCSATDTQKNTSNGSFTVTAILDNAPPVLTLPSDIIVYTSNATGAVVNFIASANDLVDGPVAVICVPASGDTFPVGATTVNCSASDSQKNTSTGSFTVTVVRNNTAPTANAGGPYLGAVNTPITFDGSASFDPEADPLTYAWDFGDSASGSGVMPTHSYSAVGVYTVCLTVNDGLLDSYPNCTTATIFDPNAGFVTGGGWIDSPAGALVSDPEATGKGHFTFVAMYHKNGNLESETEFELQAGKFHLHAHNAQWLLITGAKAQFVGQGIVEDSDHKYGFSVTVLDGNLSGGEDMFRIRIWDMDNGSLVYDSQMGDSIYANPTTPLGGGSIVFHKTEE